MTVILIISSILIIIGAITRIFDPVEINYNGMIIFAVFGVIVNFIAAYFTKGGNSLNQKSVNLHMLEDVLGWLIVLIGAIIMKFTDIAIIDPILSILVALFILVSALKNFKIILDLFLEKVPSNISVKDIREKLLLIKDIKDIHHIHIWSIDGYNNYATMHVIVDNKNEDIRKTIKEELKKHGISHVTIQIEKNDEECSEHDCCVDTTNHEHHHHHH